MFPTVATIYDQNPARIQLIARRRQRTGQPLVQAFIGIQLLVGLLVARFWNFLPD